MSCGDSGIRRSIRASKRFRSTKGASKARRDQINTEIRNMRALLPISSEEQERLSYLHSMSIICTFIRKTVMLRDVHEDAAGVSPLNESFLQALPGFIVAFTKDGKLLYVSENVQEYLGLSMVDVLQGDSFYEMLDSRDVEAVKAVLSSREPSAERRFVCRMQTSKAFRLQNGSCCSLLVKGRFQDALFVALCTPTVNRLKEPDASFQTLHRADMSLAGASCSVFFHLGFSAEELIGRSWYDFLHPDDLRLAADRHATLVRAEGDADTEMLLRMQRQDLSWLWIFVRAAVKADKHSIACSNHVISETEAVYLRDKLFSESFSQCRSFKNTVRTISESSGGSGTEVESRNTPVFSTPPYSPASSQSSDFLSEGYGALEQLVSDSHFCPSRSSPPFPPMVFPDLSCAPPPVCPPDAHLVPVYQPVLEVCEHSADGALQLEDFSMFPLAQDGASSLMTPEPSPSTDAHFLYSAAEQAEIGTLALQIRSLACSFDAYAQLHGTACWTPEPLLDEAVIDSILRDLDGGWTRLSAEALEPLSSTRQSHLCLCTEHSRTPDAFSH